MANKLDPMDLKQIIQLHLDGYSNRSIGKTLTISRNTVNEYIKLFKASDYSMEELLQLNESAFGSQFPGHTTIKNDRYNELMLYLEKAKQASLHPGFTFLHHYHEYKESVDNPYSYTQFMEHYHRKYRKIKGSLKLEHPAGKELFIDFAGKHLHIVDQHTGELKEVEVFVAILPHSHYTYVEACESQKREDLISCCMHALEFYGGVPQAIVSDNLKSAVSRASKYEPQINRAFKDFARHYHCAVNPARSYAPCDKALVENAVHLTYQRIYYPLREMNFFSLKELNQEIRKLLDRYNNQFFQRQEGSRKERFQSVERAYLKPLPGTAFELKDYKRAKVQKIGHVYFSPDKSFYSVPYRYIGKSTMVHYSPRMVEVYFNKERIALHKRNPVKGSYNTKKEHLSSTHKAYTDWSPEYFKRLASKQGEYVEACISTVLEEVEYPELGYKRAMGIIQLHKSYGSEKLNKACRRAFESDAVSYKRIENILKNHLEATTLFDIEQKDNESHIPQHDNIRGASNYK